MSVQIVLASAEQCGMPQIVPYLEQQGWQVITAKTGTETLTIIEQIRPLAAIVDVHLPDMTGWAVLQRLRHSPLFRSIVVMLVYPTEASDEDYFLGQRLGADVNMPMPLNPLEIISFLSRVLKEMNEL